jgi:hypothetical protein
MDKRSGERDAVFFGLEHSMKRSKLLGLTGLVLSLAMAAPALGEAKTTVCTMDFTLKGWSAGYKVAQGSGKITCDNGQSAQVRINTRGGGLTAGKSAIRDGHGTFTAVADIQELFKSYATAGAAAGAGKSAEAQVVTSGDVSLSLTGKGTGVELGVSFGKFTISKR